MCGICGNSEGNKRYSAREMMFGLREEFDYFQCGRCGCLQIVAAPADMSKYYPQDYYSFSMRPASHSRLKGLAVGKRDFYSATGKDILGRALFSVFPDKDLLPLRGCGITKDSKILDVGCGAGALAHRLKEAGFRNVTGADPYVASEIRYRNGLRILKKELKDIDGGWDLIMFHHSFEHIFDQRKAMETVSEKLGGKGVCLIRIPTVSSYAWEHYGVNWVQLDAPRHFFLHSVKSMGMLAESSGLKIKDTVYDSTGFQFWGSEQYLKDIPLGSPDSYLKDPGAFPKEEIISFEKRAEELNRDNKGDSAAFYLVRKDE